MIELVHVHRTASWISLIRNQLALIKDELLCHWHSVLLLFSGLLLYFTYSMWHSAKEKKQRLKELEEEKNKEIDKEMAQAEKTTEGQTVIDSSNVKDIPADPIKPHNHSEPLNNVNGRASSGRSHAADPAPTSHTGASGRGKTAAPGGPPPRPAPPRGRSLSGRSFSLEGEQQAPPPQDVTNRSRRNTDAQDEYGRRYSPENAYPGNGRQYPPENAYPGNNDRTGYNDEDPWGRDTQQHDQSWNREDEYAMHGDYSRPAYHKEGLSSQNPFRTEQQDEPEPRGHSQERNPHYRPRPRPRPQQNTGPAPGETRQNPFSDAAW